MPQSSLALTVGNVTVHQLDGLYSLNDLHAASGSEVRHQPTRFMRLDQTQALIAELANSPEMVSFKTIKGRNGGTYACRELVIAYAAWISAAFHLKVIRVFLDATGAQQQPPAYALRRRRWLFSIDCTGKEQVVMVPWDCAVIRQEEIPGLIAQGEISKPELLGQIGAACIERLSNNVAYREAA